MVVSSKAAAQAARFWGRGLVPFVFPVLLGVAAGYLGARERQQHAEPFVSPPIQYDIEVRRYEPAYPHVLRAPGAQENP